LLIITQIHYLVIQGVMPDYFKINVTERQFTQIRKSFESK